MAAASTRCWSHLPATSEKRRKGGSPGVARLLELHPARSPGSPSEICGLGSSLTMVMATYCGYRRPLSTSSQPASSSSTCCRSFSLRASRLSLITTLLRYGDAARLGLGVHAGFVVARYRGSFSAPAYPPIVTGERPHFAEPDHGPLYSVPLQKEIGVVTCPVHARGVEGLLVCDPDQQVDELALGEAGLQERAESLLQIPGVPQRPLRVGAVRLDVRLVVSLASLAKQILQPPGEIQLAHVTLLDRLHFGLLSTL